jgi:diacylglycerol diphosphate phosphatase/phosphatidate phosphatase
VKITGTHLPDYYGRDTNILSSHDVYDVTCGSLIGISMAYFSYRRYFPQLHHSKCDEPYQSRGSVFNEGFAKVKTDEEIARSREFELTDEEDAH